MKYSRLPEEELHNLEKEFIDFLVVNGITADDWVKLKEEDSEASEAIIDQFSDVIWEGVLRKTEYLEKKEEGIAYYFKCDETEIHLIRIIRNGDKMVKQVASKSYKKERESELFDMIQSGCEITDGVSYAAVL